MIDSLLDAALAAREKAHAPFSRFKVGAALQAADGTIFAGCNIESVAYGLTLCAERVALFKAVSEGVHEFSRVVVVADTAAPTPPCGACRQLLWEFCGNASLTMSNLSGKREDLLLGDLFPRPFDASYL